MPTLDISQHRVVIIGCGFGGLFAARALKGSPVQVTVVDRRNHHLFQPLLYQVATGILSEGEIAPAIRDVLRKNRNVQVMLADVTDIDLDSRVLTARQGERALSIPYDSLIVAAGTSTSYFGHPEFGRWAPGMKSVDDALELRGRIFGAFEMAETETDEDRRQALLTFAVVGGGPTGVEMAGQIVELAHRALRNNFRSIDPAKARVLLFDGADMILAQFGKSLATRTIRDLGRLGIEVHLKTMVTSVTEDHLEIRHADGTTTSIAAYTKIWAAGVEASSLGHLLSNKESVGLDSMGRGKVLADCTLPGHPEVFVIGDMMALDDLPGMAEVAMQSGVHAARVITQRLKGNSAQKPFHYRDLGSMATISRFRGVAKLGPLRVTGFFGWILWLVVHLTFLTGFKNRFTALAHWSISFIGRGRSERTITEQQVIARHAIDTAAAGKPSGAPMIVDRL